MSPMRKKSNSSRKRKCTIENAPVKRNVLDNAKNDETNSTLQLMENVATISPANQNVTPSQAIQAEVIIQKGHNNTNPNLYQNMMPTFFPNFSNNAPNMITAPPMYFSPNMNNQYMSWRQIPEAFQFMQPMNPALQPSGNAISMVKPPTKVNSSGKLILQQKLNTVQINEAIPVKRPMLILNDLPKKEARDETIHHSDNNNMDGKGPNDKSEGENLNFKLKQDDASAKDPSVIATPQPVQIVMQPNVYPLQQCMIPMNMNNSFVPGMPGGFHNAIPMQFPQMASQQNLNKYPMFNMFLNYPNIMPSMQVPMYNSQVMGNFTNMPVQSQVPPVVVSVDCKAAMSGLDVGNEYNGVKAVKSSEQKPKVTRRKRLLCTCPACLDPQKYRCPTDKKKIHICHYPDCMKEYGKTSHLRAHIRWHTGERPFVCDWTGCIQKFTRSDELQRHKRTHTGEKNFICPECHKGFIRSDHLKKHTKTHEKKRLAENFKI